MSQVCVDKGYNTSRISGTSLSQQLKAIIVQSCEKPSPRGPKGQRRSKGQRLADLIAIGRRQVQASCPDLAVRFKKPSCKKGREKGAVPLGNSHLQQRPYDNPTKCFIELLRSVHANSLRACVLLLHACLSGRIPLHVGQLLALGLGLWRVGGERRSRDAKQQTRDNRAPRIRRFCFLLLSEGVSPSPKERCALVVVARCPLPYEFVWARGGTILPPAEWRAARSYFQWDWMRSQGAHTVTITAIMHAVSSTMIE